MTNYEYIEKCFRWLSTAVIDESQRDTLSTALSEKVEKFSFAVANSIDWDELTVADVKRLGFMCYGEDDFEPEKSLWLIPVWLYLAIPEGITLYKRDTDEKFIFNRRNATYTSFYGCLDYGIRFRNAHNDNNYYQRGII